MNEQKTGPDFGESLGSISEKSLDSHAVEKLTHLGVNRETAIKLAALREDVDVQDTQILESEFSELGKNEQAEKLSQVSDILSEHRKHISDVASFERSKLRKTLNSSEINTETSAFGGGLDAIKTSIGTVGSFGIDFIKGIGETFTNLPWAVTYMSEQADGIISDEDLHYKIT